ncbi:hypothetical protein C8F04DRAFT_434868 [Mycena alexandri]|uniref:Uncharacterized protein n=1 Tax=Mycena alexandri TaxID=1745969 RepID=A0AAD6XAQ5_9AGAR|nr:hypothetical protein C8F04DRAFT_434868 [Mycena alexandri]
MDEPSIPLSLSIGFFLRIFLLAFDPHSHLRPTFVGIWEGIALYRSISNGDGPPINTYLPCACRLLFDFLFTESLNTMIPLIFSLLLAVLISDVVGAHHSHDIRPSRSDKKLAVTTTHTPQIYEVSDSPTRRMNRTRVIPRPNRETKEANQLFSTVPDLVVTAGIRTVDFAVRPDVQPQISPSPAPIEIANRDTLILDPITPPSPPSTPKRRPRRSPVDSESGSHEDELQTPTLLVMPPTLASQPEYGMTSAEAPIDEEDDRDELQTPLALKLRELPALILEQDQPQGGGRPVLLEDIPVLDDPASVHDPDTPRVEDDNLSELSLPTDTAPSIISGKDALEITAAAEQLRKQAWGEEAQKRELEARLNRAVSQKKVKEAFLLRLEIEELEQRARKLHGRAARRHYRGK